MLGVAVGALIRNQVGAIIVLAAYSLVVDAVLFAAVPSLGRFLPAQASNAFAGLTGSDLHSPAAGAAVLTAWTIVFAAFAVLRTERTDIPVACPLARRVAARTMRFSSWSQRFSLARIAQSPKAPTSWPSRDIPARSAQARPVTLARG